MNIIFTILILKVIIKIVLSLAKYLYIPLIYGKL